MSGTVIAANGDESKLFVWDTLSVYLFDMRAKSLMWKKLEGLGPNNEVGQVRARFLDSKNVIQTLDKNNFLRCFAIANGKEGQPWKNAEPPYRDPDWPQNDQLNLVKDARNSRDFEGPKEAVNSILYFSNGRRAAVGFNYQVGIYRRVRRYGWLGLLDLPLTWIALTSFAALTLIFIRWLRAKIVDRRTRNA